MLIRIVDHFRDNPKRIDKLIAIKGLPDDWMFRDSQEGRELKKPWIPDVDVNIPKDVRDVCDPMYVIIRHSSLQPNVPGVIEKRQILGVKIDYNTEPGREMWERVERYIEESVPRDERIPVPVVCSKDERSAFETFSPRRRSGSGGRLGALEMHPSPIPVVDLNAYAKKDVPRETLEVVKEVLAKVEETPKPKLFVCPDCDSVFDKERAIKMHTMKRHPKEKAVA